MGAVVLMLRGINIGRSRRIAMADLREALAAAGFDGVRTHLQSGNVVARHDREPAAAELVAAQAIRERFGLDVSVVARTHDELAAVVASNPLADVATDPKRHQVSFLSAPLSEAVAQRLRDAVVEPEALAIEGREIHAWHPEGVARSKLSNALAGGGLGVTATARNWTTVTALVEMAGGR
ncbi:MAG: DUF1697 domain-containing protein [Solirubrobacteraceae bacterium]